MQNLLVVSVLGSQQATTANELVRLIADCQCNILDARASLLAGEYSGSFLLAGNWNALAKFEHALPALATKLQLQTALKRISEIAPMEESLPYSVQIVGHDEAGILKEITQFFAVQGVVIQELYSNVYGSPHTGSATLVFNLTIHVPKRVAIALLRDQFLTLCDELNLDAVLEPIKF